jgi:hypothetical protein
MPSIPQAVLRSTGPRNLVVALAGPFLVCLALVPARDHLANTTIALVLVLVIVAVAALGSRGAGALAALSAAVWFDFFLTRPYQQFTILAARDIETTGLLFAVGIAVTEIAHWGRRQQARAGRQSGYLEALRVAADAVAGGTAGRDTLIEGTCRQLAGILGASAARFEPTGAGGRSDHPRLQADGGLVWGEVGWDVDRAGLPVQVETEIPVVSGGRSLGRFLVSAPPDTRPGREQRTLAVALANLIAVALAAPPAGTRPAKSATRGDQLHGTLTRRGLR